MVELSPIQSIARARKQTGLPIYLRLGEELLASNFHDDQISLMIRTVKIKDYSVGYKVTAQGTKLAIYSQVDHPAIPGFKVWTEEKMVTWDPDFVPYEVGTLGGRSVPEYRERTAWEDDCYRPGNGTRLGQRDSADRVLQGYDYTQPQFYTTSTTRKG